MADPKLGAPGAVGVQCGEANGCGQVIKQTMWRRQQARTLSSYEHGSGWQASDLSLQLREIFSFFSLPVLACGASSTAASK